MSGLKVRVGAVLFAASALSAGVAHATTPVVPVMDPSSSSSETVTIAPLSTQLGAAGTDALPAPIANQTSTTVIPLPPGVIAGLFGLASAAIARRRYLRRH